MKPVCLLAVFLFLLSSANGQEKLKSGKQTINIIREVTIFRDSLRQQGVDTILIYYQGFKENLFEEFLDQSAYVFWKHHGMVKARKVNNFKGWGIAYPSGDVIAYHDDHYKQLDTETLNEPKVPVSDKGQYSGLTLYAPGAIFAKSIPDHLFFKENEDKFIMNWIYRIESCLFRLEHRAGFSGM